MLPNEFRRKLAGMPSPDVVETSVIEPEAVGLLVTSLRQRGYRVLGPTVRDGAIVYDDLAFGRRAPVGWTDVQEPGSYRLERRDDEALFGYAVGPHSWKQFLFPPRIRLWKARRSEDGVFEVEDEARTDERFAFLGVRSCELHAIDIQDRVFLGGPATSSGTTPPVARTHSSLPSTASSPAATASASRWEPARRRRPGTTSRSPRSSTTATGCSSRSAASVAPRCCVELPRRPAAEADLRAAEASVAGAAEKMGRTLDTKDLPGLLARTLEHGRWDEVAERCLTCGNCTMVCPTCFCSTRRGRDRSRRRRSRARRAPGTPASRSTTRTSTAAPCDRRGARAIASG